MRDVEHVPHGMVGWADDPEGDVVLGQVPLGMNERSVPTVEERDFREIDDDALGAVVPPSIARATSGVGRHVDLRTMVRMTASPTLYDLSSKGVAHGWAR